MHRPSRLRVPGGRRRGSPRAAVATVPPLDTPIIDGHLGWHYHTGGHIATRADRQAFLAFFEKHL